MGYSTADEVVLRSQYFRNHYYHYYNYNVIIICIINYIYYTSRSGQLCLVDDECPIWCPP